MWQNSYYGPCQGLWLRTHSEVCLRKRGPRTAFCPHPPKKEFHRRKGGSCLFVCLYVGFWRDSPPWARDSSFTRFLDHTQRRITGGRTPLDEWSARRRDLYLTTHNTHNRQTSMAPVGFEPTISAGERPQSYALDGAATGTGSKCCRFSF